MSVDATRWAWMQENMRPSQKILLLSLADRANEDNVCWPSYERLKKDTGLDVRTIKSSLDDLCDQGYIERHYNNGRGYIYHLIGVENREDTPPKNVPRPPSKVHTESKREPKKNLKAFSAPSPTGHRAVAGTLVCSFKTADERRKRKDSPPAENLTGYFLPVKSKEMSEVVYLKAANWRQWEKIYGKEMCLYCLKEAYRWLLDNPERAKTPQGIHRFFGNWISREQNKRGQNRASPVSSQRTYLTLEEMAEQEELEGTGAMQ